MSEIRSDNRLEQHPKPVQEYERKFNGTGYEDWASTAEMEAVYNIAYRKNKYFWIAGDYFECLDDGVTYRQVNGGGGGGTVTITATGDATGVSDTSNTPTLPLTLATVNSDVGTYGDSTHVARVTVNGKGLTTAVEEVAIVGGIATVEWSVLDILNAPPVSSTTGDTYLVGTAGTGLWSGHNNEITVTPDNGATWTFQTATVGDLLYNADENLSGNDGVYQNVTGNTWQFIGKPVIHQGGDNYGANIVIGSIDNSNFVIRTHNITRVTIARTGGITFNNLTGSGDQLMGLANTGLASRVAIGTGLSLTGGTLNATGTSGVTTFSAGTTGLTPNTATTGAVVLSGTLDVDNGGTGQTSYTDGQLLIGNTSGNTLTKASLSAGTGVTITPGNGSITIAATGTGGTVTSITANSPITATPSPITGTGVIAINDAAADGTTKGAASFTANDFNATSGNISLDYTNGQKASSTVPGFETANQTLGAIGCFVTGNQTFVSTGTVGFITIPYSGTLLTWYVAATATGNIQFDIKRSGTSIVGAGNKPFLSGTASGNALIAGWTSVTVTAGDILEIVVDSSPTPTIVNGTMVLQIAKT